MSRLNYHHLYYFWQVATHGNLTQVASLLHVSQSALSSQIRQLEDSMNTRLFERAGRRLVLTESGQRVLGFAADIFRKGEELEALIGHGIAPEFETLRIGMLATMSRNFIESFIAPLLNRSNIRFSLHARSMADLLDGLATHQFDLVLTNYQITSSQETHIWQSQLLARQPLAIVGPAAQCPEGAFPAGYADKRWVLPSIRTESRAAFDGFCAAARFEPDVLAEADDMAMLRLLARDSGALAVLPAVVVRDELESGLLAEYMKLPNGYENFYVLTVEREYRPAVLRTLLSGWELVQD